MAKINRFSGNVQAFASQAQGTERTVFGDTAQGDTLDANITAEWLRGWGIVGVNEYPTKQDFNGLAFTLGQLIAYLHQAGIPEWNADQEYYEGSVVTTMNGVYRLLSGGDGSIGPDADDGANWEKAPTRAEINQRVIRVSSVAELISLPEPVNGAQFSVASYHGGWAALASKPKGGGSFVWDATAAKSRHDGGTVIDPLATLPSGFEETNRAAAYDWFYQPAATGTGCFIRVMSDNEPYNLNAFGCKGDGLSDDSIPVQFCLYRAIYNQKGIFAPAGVYLKGFALDESFPVSSGGSRWLDFLLPEGCEIKISGEGKALTEFKVADNLISTRGRFTFTFGWTAANGVNAPRFVSCSDFTINQNGTNNPLGGGDGPFEFEQAHCFLLDSHDHSEFRNVHIKDKVGGGIVFGSGIAGSFLTDNITQSDWSGNFGERADVESQGFAELASVVNCIGRYMQVESNSVAPAGRQQQVEIVNSKFDVIDLAGGANIDAFFAKMTNTTARVDSYFSEGVFQASNCVFRHSDNFEWSSWREGSVFSDTTILLAVDGSDVVASIRPRLISDIGGICEWTFDNCSILIDSDDPLFVPSNANYLFLATSVYSDTNTTDCRFYINDCKFDRRTKGIVNNYRSYPATVSRSRITCTDFAFQAGQDAGRQSGIALIDNDYSQFEGAGVINWILAAANVANFGLTMKESMRADQMNMTYGSGTNPGTVEQAGTFDMRTELYGSANPAAALKGMRLYNESPASATWYIRVSTGGNAFVDAITLP
jgi:hypothetical protein